MQIIMLPITKVLYKVLIRPVLFGVSTPDAIHQKMLSFGGRVQNGKILRWLMRNSWSYKNEKYLAQNLKAIHFSNPIGLSAGFDKNFDIPLLMEDIGFGFMEGGSITSQPCIGNPRPWFKRLVKSKSIVVHVGLANHGATQILPKLKVYPVKIPLNISVAKTNSQIAATDELAIIDYKTSVEMIKDLAVGEMVTLNISCPNAFGGEQFTTPDRLSKLLDAIVELNISQPIFLKMPLDLELEQFNSLLDVAVKYKIAGVIIANLLKDRTSLDIVDKLDSSTLGGLSGKPTFKPSNLLIKQTYKLYGDKLTIIGVGGVFSAEDAYAKIRCGASLVSLVTGLIFEGPQLIGDINRGLVKLLKRDGFTNIADAIGIDVK